MLENDMENRNLPVRNGKNDNKKALSKSNPVKPVKNESTSVGVPRNAAYEASRSPMRQLSANDIKRRNKRASSLTPVRSPGVVTVRKDRDKRTPLPIAGMFSAVILTLMFLFMIMNYAEVDRYNSEIAELNANCAQLQQEAYELQSKLDKREDRSKIESYAVDKLGMVKEDSLTKQYVDLSPEDITTVLNRNRPQETGVGVLLSGFGEVLRNFLNN